MGREDQIINERLRKIKELRDLKINPYAHRFGRKHLCSELQEKYKKLKNGEKVKDKVVIAGRLLIKRDLGKISFATLQDGSGRIQIILQEGETPEEIMKIFKRYVDAGDFVGVEGVIMKSKTGELSILVKKLELLTKAILPLPEKFHGIQDDEEKLRKRYLDIIMNPEVKELFVKKQKFWSTIRNFLLERGFLEVETPVLENSAGGASATPFSTHHNALDIDIYLRISMGELWQKKLMVAGYDKTFEIGRQFRNEGMDMEHLQDYSQMEFYWAYADYNDGMKLVEEMYKEITKAVLGTLKFETHGHKIDLGKKWEIYDYETVIKKYTGVDIYKASIKEIKEKLTKLNVEYDNSVDKWKLIDVLWKFTRKQLIGPGFLTGQPVEVSPLAKRNPKDSRKVEQFQVIIAGTELGNGYSELNDPMDQEERFVKQAEMKEAGDTEAQDYDKEFVEALKYGMPPTCGFGVSERFFGYLVNRPLRECVIFPLMKPAEGSKVTEVKKNFSGNETKINLKLPMNRAKAIELVKKYNKEKQDMIHFLESEVIMRAMAERFGEDKEIWGMIGLLHDIDWGLTKTNVSEHTVKTADLLKKEGFEDEFIRIIQSHNYGWLGGKWANLHRTKRVEYALAAGETLTGLIHAYALMRGGKISDMDVNGLMKKFKDPRFAAKIDRSIVREGEKLGLSLDEFFELSINAIKEIKDEIGLK